MAQRFLDCGNEVTVWNRTSSTAEALVAAGAHVAETPAAAAQASEVVITIVRDAKALRAVTEGADGVVAGLGGDSLLIEMSTVGPAAIHELASCLNEGAALLDAPVLGSVGEASAGTLRIFVGGAENDFARARPVLDVLGDALHVGGLGSGAAAKLIANSTLFGALGVLGEAIALADGLGLSREAAFAVLAATPSAAQAERRRGAIENGDYSPRFPLSLARKDADLILAAAAEAGVELPLAAVAGSLLTAAEAEGLGDLDYSALLGHIIGQELR